MDGKTLPGYDFETSGQFWNIFKKIPGTQKKEWILSMPEEKLLLEAEPGVYIVHLLASGGHLPEERLTPKILALRDMRHKTVAHFLAESGILPQKLITPEILSLKDNEGYSVAHILAYAKAFPKQYIADSRILSLTNNKKLSVEELLLSTNQVPPEHITPDMAKKKFFNDSFGKPRKNNKGIPVFIYGIGIALFALRRDAAAQVLEDWFRRLPEETFRLAVEEHLSFKQPIPAMKNLCAAAETILRERDIEAVSDDIASGSIDFPDIAEELYGILQSGRD